MIARFKLFLDDALLLMVLTVTIFHTNHVLSVFEEAGLKWAAWPLAGALDVLIARSAWVATKRSRDRQAQWGIIFTGFFTLFSYSLNAWYYAPRAEWVSLGLALLLPAGLISTSIYKAYASDAPAQPTAPIATQPTSIEIAHAPADGGESEQDARETVVAAVQAHTANEQDARWQQVESWRSAQPPLTWGAIAQALNEPNENSVRMGYARFKKRTG